MQTIVMGKKLKNKYMVIDEKNKDGKFIGRPWIKELSPEVTWEEICRYDGTAQTRFCYIYLSEDEDVYVENEIFRADLGNYIQYTEKVLKESDGNKKSCEKELKSLLAEYNKQMIEKDEKAKAYCDLHKLDYAESDYDEILKIIGVPINVHWEEASINSLYSRQTALSELLGKYPDRPIFFKENKDES